MNAVDPLHTLVAAKRVQQTLTRTPNDVHALLQLATMLGALGQPDLDTKRKVLNKILSLDPANQQAREMLLEMDRAAMGETASQAAPVNSTEQRPASTVAPSLNELLAKPRMFRYSILLQLLVYSLMVFAIYLLLTALQSGDSEASIVFGIILLSLVIPVWFISAKLEVSSSGLKLSRLFGVVCQEVAWEDIAEFRSNVLGQGMRLLTKDGRVVELSSQLQRYAVIVELLRKMRPDFFSIAMMSSPDGSSVVSGTKTFQKTFFLKYGPFLLLIVGSLGLLTSVFTLQCVPAVLIVVILFFLWRFALYAPYTVRMEGNRLWTYSFLKKRELAPQEIKDIRIISQRTRRGFKRNRLQIDLLDGGFIYLSGFPEGHEIMYGFLKSWWAACQNA